MQPRIIAAVLASALALSPVGWTEAHADGTQAQASASAPEAGFFFYAGGTVRAKRARTQTSPTFFNVVGSWLRPSPALNTTLTYVVPSGTSDLLNVTFSGECAKSNGGQLRIRVLDNGVPLEPYDGGQVFCSSSLPATYSGAWVRRVGAGGHSLQVQFLNSGGGAGVIDDWTFELVVYD